MAEEKAQVPFGEMIALWQKMMWWDLHRIAEGISTMRVQIEAMRGYLEGVERAVAGRPG